MLAKIARLVKRILGNVGNLRFGSDIMRRDSGFVRLADVRAAPANWLWADRILLGALNEVVGDPGQGKSNVCYDLAARLTTGRPMPFCTTATSSAGVLLLQGEDPLQMIQSNLEAAGADLSRVLAYDKSRLFAEPFLLPRDLPILETSVAENGVRLVVIDPSTAFFEGDANSNRGVRAALIPLAAFAERTETAIILVRHLNKAASRNALYRGAGAITFVAAARSALLAAGDPSTDEPFRHVLALQKSNQANAASLSYQTVKKSGGITIDWLGESRFTAQELIDAEREESSALLEAGRVLYTILSEGPVWAEDVKRTAAKAGVSTRTLHRAKKLLGAESRHDGAGPGSRWWWALPDDRSKFRAFEAMEFSELTHRLCHREAGPDSPTGREQDGRPRNERLDPEDDGGQAAPRA